MHEYDLGGESYDIGLQNARLLHQTAYSPRPATAEQLRFARECAAAVERHAPWLLEEISGVIDAGIFDPVVAEVLPLTLYADSGCSVVAVSGARTRDGRPLFGRNYDFFASFHQYNSLYRTRPAGYLAHIGCSDQWVGRHDGMNEAGLAIGHSGPVPGTRRPGFVITLAIRAVLDTCRTVAEAQGFLEKIPHLGNTAFLVADASGAIAAVDASPDRVVTTHLRDGFGFLANQYVSPEMIAAAPPGRVPGSERRIRNFKRWSARHSRVQMGDVQEVLRHPENGVCASADRHPGADDPDVTLWSWTASPGDSVLFLAKGTPNATPYGRVAVG